MTVHPLFSCLPKAALAALVLALPCAAQSTAPKISLTWDDNSTDESGFKIERAEPGKAFAQVGTVAANVTTYTDQAVTTGVEYTYRVRAFSAYGDSQPSNVITATATTSSAIPPSNVTIGIKAASN